MISPNLHYYTVLFIFVKEIGMPLKQDLVTKEKQVWDDLIRQIEVTFDKGKVKSSEESETLLLMIKEYKACHEKRFISEIKGKD